MTKYGPGDFDRYIVGDQIRMARKNLHLTQRDTALACGMTRQEWSSIENGYATTLDKLMKAISYLGEQNVLHEEGNEWWHLWAQTLLHTTPCPRWTAEHVPRELLQSLVLHIKVADLPGWILDAQTWNILYYNDALAHEIPVLRRIPPSSRNFLRLLMDPATHLSARMPGTNYEHYTARLVTTYRLSSACYAGSPARQELITRMSNDYPAFAAHFYNPVPDPFLGPYTFPWVSAEGRVTSVMNIAWSPHMVYGVVVKLYRSGIGKAVQ